VVTREELLAAIRAEISGHVADGMRPAETKIVSRAEIPGIASNLRKQGRRMVFANGCFDILHAGHVRYLAGARAEGDVLFVAVNGDSGVQGLKGPGRPVLAGTCAGAAGGGVARGGLRDHFSGGQCRKVARGIPTRRAREGN